MRTAGRCSRGLLSIASFSRDGAAAGLRGLYGIQVLAGAVNPNSRFEPPVFAQPPRGDTITVPKHIAPDDHRAEAVSAFYIACVGDNSVPVIGIGVLSTLTTPLTATVTFAVAIAACAVAALLWHRAAGRTERSSRTSAVSGPRRPAPGRS
jgi:hypothetical protein